MTPPERSAPPPVLFDVYGTLLDVGTLARACELMAPGRGAELARLWRAKQLEYTWLRSAAGRYENFRSVTEAAARHACLALGVQVTEDAVASLCEGYLLLQPFPDAEPTLRTVRDAGHRCGVLSNGVLEMLNPALERAGLLELLDPVLSADAVHRFKPSARVYGLGPTALGLPADRIAFVSANGWDIAGAGWFGYRTFWVNRAAQPAEELGVAAAGSGADLTALPAFLDGGGVIRDVPGQ